MRTFVRRSRQRSLGTLLWEKPLAALAMAQAFRTGCPLSDTEAMECITLSGPAGR